MLSAILRDPFRRSRLFTLLTALFAFLWPLLGAAPILALWLVHVVLLFRGIPYRGLRVFYGAVAALAALFLAVSFLEQTTEYGITGLLCVLAVAAAWGAGRLKAGKHEKAQLDRMKAKDL